MATDIAMITTEIALERWKPIFSSPDCAFAGAQGVSSDETASLSRGWGAYPFGTLTSETWTPSTHALIAGGRISINPLELMASAAVVVLLDSVVSAW